MQYQLVAWSTAIIRRRQYVSSTVIILMHDRAIDPAVNPTTPKFFSALFKKWSVLHSCSSVKGSPFSWAWKLGRLKIHVHVSKWGSSFYPCRDQRSRTNRHLPRNGKGEEWKTTHHHLPNEIKKCSDHLNGHYYRHHALFAEEVGS